MLGLAKLALAVPALLWAGYQDIKRREVSDWAWPPLAAAACISAYEAWGDALLTFTLAFWLWVACALAALAHASGLWGQGDSILLPLLAASFPWSPVGDIGDVGGAVTFFVLVVALTAPLFCAFMLANLARNLKHRGELAGLPLATRAYVLLACVKRGEFAQHAVVEGRADELSWPLLAALCAAGGAAGAVAAWQVAPPLAPAFAALSALPVAEALRSSEGRGFEPVGDFVPYGVPLVAVFAASLLAATALAALGAL